MDDRGDTPAPVVHIRLDPELRLRLDEFCQRSRRSLTNAVNLCIERYLDTVDASRSDGERT
jgi:hypothetical protein